MSSALIVFLVRTRRPFYLSRPSRTLFVMTLIVSRPDLAIRKFTWCE